MPGRETSGHETFHAGSRSYGFGSAQAIVLAVGATSAPTSAVIPKGEYRVVATTALWWTQGATPTAAVATAGSAYMPANVPELMQFNGSEKVAAIRASADGTLSLIKVD